MTQEELKQRLIEIVQTATIEMNYCTSDGIPVVTTEKHIVDEREALPLINHLIANGVTIRERGEWVPVTERLPNKRDLERSQFHNFLVANEFGEVREAVFTGKHFAKLGSRLSGVTHWMPLPEPPETEKGGE